MGYISKGQAVVTKQRNVLNFVSIIQGTTYFHGRYNESSNKEYFVVFNEGHVETFDGKEKWINGQVCLVNDLNNVLWVKILERPNDGNVSNNGRVVINDWLKNTKKAGGKFYVFDLDGAPLLEKEFDSNLSACDIHDEGKYAVVSTLHSDNSIYLFDVDKRELIWRYQNHSRKSALGLKIDDTGIQVFTGSSTATRKLDYSLDFKGELSDRDAETLNKVRTISEGNITDSINTITSFLKSSDKMEVKKGLEELRLPKSRFKNYSNELILCISVHVLDDDEEISQLAEDVILRFGEKNPDAIDPAVEIMLKRIDEYPRKIHENDLFTLGKIGKIKPQAVKTRIPKIINDLETSPHWNERRFAAYALGMIGSADQESVKESIPILAKYLEDSKWTKRVDSDDAIVDNMMQMEPDVWVRDAAILALGEIGEKNAEIVKDVIPKIVACLRRRESYTRKRVVVTLGQIGKSDRSLIEPYFKHLEKIIKEDSDEKVRFEAKKVYESLTL
jgi:hypothetical protein